MNKQQRNRMKYRLTLDHVARPLIEHSFIPGVYVETGVYRGETFMAMCSRFRQSYALELEADRARELEERVPDNCKVLQGDSGELLFQVCQEVAEPMFVYLDAHWWKNSQIPVAESDNPLLAELVAIRNHKQADFVVIDDTHLFWQTKNPKDCRKVGVDLGWLGLNHESVLSAIGRNRVAGFGYLPYANKRRRMWLSMKGE